MDKISLCIIFFEKPDQTINCIRSVVDCNVPIYVLNNGSSVTSAEKVREYCARYRQVHFFSEEYNVGVGPARNLLIGYANEEWLFFLDNDITVDNKNWHQNLLREIADVDKGWEVLIPRLFNRHENRWQKYRNIRISDGNLSFEDKSSHSLNWFPGGASLVNRSVFERLGHYDENIFVGGEDIEFGLRGIFSGNPVHARLIDSVSVTHSHEKVSTEDDSRSVKIRYDLSSIKKSFGLIESKYGIIIPEDWMKWNLCQKRLMIHGMSIYYYLKIKIRRLVEKILGVS